MLDLQFAFFAMQNVASSQMALGALVVKINIRLTTHTGDAAKLFR